MSSISLILASLLTGKFWNWLTRFSIWTSRSVSIDQEVNILETRKTGHNQGLVSLKKFHYEAKLCILCIVSGIRNRPKSDLSRNPQHCYFSLIFYAVLDSTNKYLNHCTAQNRSKNRRICGICNSE